MSCCWRPVAHRQQTAGRRAPQPDGTGVIQLTSYPDGGLPYSGPSAGQALYLVGWRSEHERLFLGTDGKAAVAYRNSIDKTLPIDRVTAQQLPTGAVQALLAQSAG